MLIAVATKQRCSLFRDEDDDKLVIVDYNAVVLRYSPFSRIKNPLIYRPVFGRRA